MIRLRWALKRWMVGQFGDRESLERLHADKPTFWCRDADDLPSPAALQETIAARCCGALLFSKRLRPAAKTRCVAHVRAALPGVPVGAVTRVYGFDSLGFARVLSRAEITDHAPELLESAREFGALATELAHELAAKIGVTPAQLTSCGQYQPRETRPEQRGNLNDEWRYCFHGFQCGFVHRHNGQDVDVEFGFGAQFGVLDPMFWLRFLQTTPRYQHLARWMALGYADAKTMFDVLVETGDLVEIEGQLLNWERRGFVPKPNF